MIVALSALLRALAYFTILPIPARAAGPPDRAALGYLPVAGAVAGALAGACGWIAGTYAPQWAGLTAWIATLIVTGAIHVDGFLDCCDALGATTTVQRRLDILRDPHHGTYALAGMAALALVWVRALELLPVAQLPLALAFAAAAARLGALANAFVFPYARADGFAAALVRPPSAAAIAAGVALAAVLGWFVAPGVLIALAAAPLLGLLLGWSASRRLGGGITGDVYGAVAVVLEVTVLLAIPFLERLR